MLIKIKIEKNVPQVNVVGLFGTTVYENTDNVKSDVRWPISDGRFLNLMQKESDPSSPLYVTLCNNFEESEQAVNKAREERDREKTIASKKYKQRINRAEKNGDEAELERIRLEQEESQRCQAELSKLESELKSKQKELSEIRKGSLMLSLKLDISTSREDPYLDSRKETVLSTL